jgi:hypothetical protein
LPLCTILTEELVQEKKKFEKWRERGDRGGRNRGGRDMRGEGQEDGV